MRRFPSERKSKKELREMTEHWYAQYKELQIKYAIHLWNESFSIENIGKIINMHPNNVREILDENIV